MATEVVAEAASRSVSKRNFRKKTAPAMAQALARTPQLHNKLDVYQPTSQAEIHK